MPPELRANRKSWEDFDPENRFRTIRVTINDRLYHSHLLPPLETLRLLPRLQTFPRTVHEENFGYPWYLYEDGHWKWKLRWAARAASRAWGAAMAHGDIERAVPPRCSGVAGQERQEVLEDSLCLAIVDRALEMCVARGPAAGS